MSYRHYVDASNATCADFMMNFPREECRKKATEARGDGRYLRPFIGERCVGFSTDEPRSNDPSVGRILHVPTKRLDKVHFGSRGPSSA